MTVTVPKWAWWALCAALASCGAVVGVFALRPRARTTPDPNVLPSRGAQERNEAREVDREATEKDEALSDALTQPTADATTDALVELARRRGR